MPIVAPIVAPIVSLTYSYREANPAVDHGAHRGVCIDAV